MARSIVRAIVLAVAAAGLAVPAARAEDDINVLSREARNPTHHVPLSQLVVHPKKKPSLWARLVKLIPFVNEDKQETVTPLKDQIAPQMPGTATGAYRGVRR
jgi:hypothetical protein